MNVLSLRISELASELADPDFRTSYSAAMLKMFLADQIRALRGDRSQTEFGQTIDKPQSVVSRLENEAYGRVTVQTLIDIASKMDIALLIRFVEWPTFLQATADFRNRGAPRPYQSKAIIEFAKQLEARARQPADIPALAAFTDQKQEVLMPTFGPSQPLRGNAAEAAWIDAWKNTRQPIGELAA